MTKITIELVDKRHVVARSKAFEHGAKNWHFYDEKAAQKFLSDTLRQYKNLGYSVKEVAPNDFELIKDVSVKKTTKAKGKGN